MAEHLNFRQRALVVLLGLGALLGIAAGLRSLHRHGPYGGHHRHWGPPPAHYYYDAPGGYRPWPDPPWAERWRNCP